jgi:hypothetical protein
MELPAHPFRYDSLATLGLSPRQLRNAVDQGLVRRLLTGVYADGSLPDDTTLRARAAALVVAPGAVVCDRSAAWLHGIDVFDPGQRARTPLLEVVSPCAGAAVRRGEVLGGRRDLQPGDVIRIEGVAVTTPLRTACDLARLRGRSSAYAALCMFAREHGITGADIAAVLPRYRGRRGVIQLRELAGRMTARCESPGEAWTLLALLDAGLPLPEPQVVVDLAGFGRVRLDLAYRLIRVAIEYDGEEHHSSPEDVAYDEARRAALREAGWTVVVVRRHELSGVGLEGWIAQVRAALVDAASPQRRVYARAPRSDRRH